MVRNTQIPYEEWCQECRSLYPFTPVGSMTLENGHKVNKDNSIKYCGNIYSVPLGTYRDESTRVLVMESDGDLIISSIEGKEIARHVMPAGRGNKVINKNHYRNTSTKLEALIEQTSSLFSNKALIGDFLEKIRIRYARYVRDQIAVIQQCVVKYGQEAADRALEKCVELRLYSANDFKSIISASNVRDTVNESIIAPLGDGAARMLANISPNMSSINTYEKLWNNN